MPYRYNKSGGGEGQGQGKGVFIEELRHFECDNIKCMHYILVPSRTTILIPRRIWVQPANNISVDRIDAA